MERSLLLRRFCLKTLKGCELIFPTKAFVRGWLGVEKGLFFLYDSCGVSTMHIFLAFLMRINIVSRNLTIFESKLQACCVGFI